MFIDSRPLTCHSAILQPFSTMNSKLKTAFIACFKDFYLEYILCFPYSLYTSRIKKDVFISGTHRCLNHRVINCILKVNILRL